jgi:hypothetical protein
MTAVAACLFRVKLRSIGMSVMSLLHPDEQTLARARQVRFVPRADLSTKPNHARLLFKNKSIRGFQLK